MLVFDRRALRCVVPPTEDCDIPTTPAPAEGDLPDGNANDGSYRESPQQVRSRRSARGDGLDISRFPVSGRRAAAAAPAEGGLRAK